MTAADPILGRTLAGRYRITALLGTGGFAAVYRGEQDAEPREVAIKILSPKHAGERSAMRRFRREARAASMLVHPNTVRILEHGLDGDLAYIVMELLRGYDLFEALVRERRLDEARAVRIIAQVCEALSEAHDRGIVHRDLKPENIWLVGDPAEPALDRVKVLDFGIAKLQRRDPPEEATTAPAGDEAPSSSPSAISKVGNVMGTPHYVSPELGRAEPIDGRSDVYACGVLLYQLLTGQLPFDGETPLQVVMRHVHDKPRPLGMFVPRLSSRLEAVVLKALAKQPVDRHQSAEELRRELLDLLPELATSPHPSLRGELAAGRAPAAPGEPTPDSLDVPDRPLARRSAAEFPTLPIQLGLDTPSQGYAPPAPEPPLVEAMRPSPPPAPAPPAVEITATLRSRIADGAPPASRRTAALIAIAAVLLGLLVALVAR